MSENILEKIIQKKIDKVDNLKKTIDLKSLEKYFCGLLDTKGSIATSTHDQQTI